MAEGDFALTEWRIERNVHFSDGVRRLWETIATDRYPGPNPDRIAKICAGKWSPKMRMRLRLRTSL